MAGRRTPRCQEKRKRRLRTSCLLRPTKVSTRHRSTSCTLRSTSHPRGEISVLPACESPSCWRMDIPCSDDENPCACSLPSSVSWLPPKSIDLEEAEITYALHVSLLWRMAEDSNPHWTTQPRLLLSKQTQLPFLSAIHFSFVLALKGRQLTVTIRTQ